MICWSCQLNVHPAESVRLDDVRGIPCCRECWESIPVAQRLAIAVKYDVSSEIRNAAESFADALARQQREDDPFGLFGSN